VPAVLQDRENDLQVLKVFKIKNKITNDLSFAIILPAF
jgi:hypothetical protein